MEGRGAEEDERPKGLQNNSQTNHSYLFLILLIPNKINLKLQNVFERKARAIKNKK
jgi:hypothetical protein